MMDDVYAAVEPIRCQDQHFIISLNNNPKVAESTLGIKKAILSALEHRTLQQLCPG